MGARWQDLPDQYPSPLTCWRRLQISEEQDVWSDIGRAFLGTLDVRKQLNRMENNRGRRLPHRRPRL